MKNYKNKIIAGVIVALVLAFVFWWGGDAPNLRDRNTDVNQVQTKVPSKALEKEIDAEPEQVEEQDNASAEKEGEPATEENKPQNTDNSPMTAEEKIALAERMTENVTANVQSGDADYSEQKGMVINDSTGKDDYQTEPVPEGRPVPIEPENAVISDKELTCTMSVRCDTILKNIAWLDKEKRELVPSDGIIFEEQTVTFYEGESVFNLLLREMKRNKIHMEFVSTPIYNSAYIEGIGNIYEYDCGELSGWMYRVNDWFPNYGCSRYQLKEGDKVEWLYTCDLGTDVGGNYSARNGKRDYE
ncbi:MAG: DUF4430 domain-containing protein [Monoglobaceae bacterium]